MRHAGAARPLRAGWVRTGRARLAALAGVIALAAPAPSARAQLFDDGGLFSDEPEAPRPKTEEEIGVPAPMEGEVEALKGQEVTFEIEAETKTPGATVEFLVRRFPSAGKIVSLVTRKNQRNKAIVTYYASPDSGADSDVFTFAARYRGGRYSSAVPFQIELVDRRAEIHVPDSLDFGEVLVGEEAVREITVRNVGDGQFARALDLASPWHVESLEDGKLRVDPEGSSVLELAFRPRRTGETSYFLSLSRSENGTVKLEGRGGAPFSVATEEVKLKLDPATGERRGEIELRNRGSESLQLQARAHSRLENSLEETYFVPAEESRRIEVHLGRTDTAPFDGRVEFALENGYRQAARVLAPVVPARLEVSIPGTLSSEVINFGQVGAGRSTERRITLTNRGGESVPLKFHIPKPFRLLNEPGPKLAPLSSVDLLLGLYPGRQRRGMVDSTMTIAGNEQTLPIRLLGNVVETNSSDGATVAGAVADDPASPLARMRLRADPEGGEGESDAAGGDAAARDPDAPPDRDSQGAAGGGSPALGNDSSARAEGGEPWHSDVDAETRESARSPLGFVTRPLVGREVDRGLDRPEDLSVIESDSDSLTIGWTAPRESESLDFEVEMRGMAVNAETNRPESVWVPYERVEFDRVDRLAKAKIEGLAPRTRYEFRVFTVSEEGKASPPSAAMVAETELPMDWTYIYFGFGLLCLGLLGYGVRKIVLARRADVYQPRYVDA